MLGFHWHSNTKCEVDSAAKERSGPEVIDIALKVWTLCCSIRVSRTEVPEGIVQRSNGKTTELRS